MNDYNDRAHINIPKGSPWLLFMKGYDLNFIFYIIVILYIYIYIFPFPQKMLSPQNVFMERLCILF